MAIPDTAKLTIVGLGPGKADLLTLEARDVLAAAPEVWLRTARHPTVPGLPDGPRYESFDAVYDGAETFEYVYREIASRVIELASGSGGAVYAVPGHPLVGEATTRAIMEVTRERGIETRIVAGMSFLDVLTPIVAIDPLADGLLVVDALELGAPRRLLTPQRPTVVAQVYDRRTASHAKLALLEAYPPTHIVRVVRASGSTDPSVIEVEISRLDHADVFDHLTSIYVPPLAIIDDVRTFEGVRAIVAQLRSPDGGCPWDLQQTHATLKRYLLEEAYEAIDALDESEPTRLAEELGDLLMQIVLQAQVAEDAGEFRIEDVCAGIGAKLVRRHPHVFGDVVVSSAGDVLRNWDELKKDERGDAPLLDAVPISMPALAQAQSVQGRAYGAGFAADSHPAATAADALSTFASVEHADATALGRLLFAVVGLARERGIDAEEALRLAVREFRASVAQEERAAKP